MVRHGPSWWIGPCLLACGSAVVLLVGVAMSVARFHADMACRHRVASTCVVTAGCGRLVSQLCPSGGVHVDNIMVLGGVVGIVTGAVWLFVVAVVGAPRRGP